MCVVVQKCPSKAICFCFDETTAAPLPGEFYELLVVGWDSSRPRLSRVIGGPDFVDLRSSDAIANFLMSPF